MPRAPRQIAALSRIPAFRIGEKAAGSREIHASCVVVIDGLSRQFARGHAVDGFEGNGGSEPESRASSITNDDVEAALSAFGAQRDFDH